MAAGAAVAAALSSGMPSRAVGFPRREKSCPSRLSYLLQYSRRRASFAAVTADQQEEQERAGFQRGWCCNDVLHMCFVGFGVPTPRRRPFAPVEIEIDLIG